jgi:hypothetical protein
MVITENRWLKKNMYAENVKGHKEGYNIYIEHNKLNKSNIVIVSS